MILTTTTPFNVMIAGHELNYAWRVTATLPGAVFPDQTLTLQKVNITAATTTDLPDGTRLQVGYPAINADFTLAGLVDPTNEAKSVAWLFGRYSATSPLWQQDVLHCTVTIDLGLYTANAGGTPEFVRKFTGKIDDYTTNQDGSVDFSAIDVMRASLRSIPDLPAVITAAPYNAGMTSEFVMDRILRGASNGAVSSWPAQRARVGFAVGLRASLWAEVGALLTGNSAVPTFAPGKWGSALTGQGATWQTLPMLGDDFTTEFAISGTAGCQIAYQAGTQFWTVIASGANLTIKLTVSTWTDSVTLTGVLTGSPQYIGVHWHWPVSGASNWNADVRVDGTSHTIASRPAADNRDANPILFCATTLTSGGIEAIQGTTESAPAWNDGFAPQAVLDPSLNNLIVVPDISGDPYQAIQALADAELGVAGGDESGIFQFYNRRTVNTAPVARAFTSAASLTAIGGVETTAAAVVNRCDVDYQPWTFATTSTFLYSAQFVNTIPAGKTVQLQKSFVGTGIADLTAPVLMGNGVTDTAHNYYRASVDSAGSAPHTGLTWGAGTQTSPTSATFPVTNHSNRVAYLVSPATYIDIPVGTACFHIDGILVTQADSSTVTYAYPPLAEGGPALLSRFGEVAASISSNPLIQDVGSATQLATDVVVSSCVPKPNLTGVEVVFDPRVQLIDVVHIQDPDVTQVDEYARVFGWDIDWEAGDDDSPPELTMTLDARTLAAPGGGIVGISGRASIGAGSTPGTLYIYPVT